MKKTILSFVSLMILVASSAFGQIQAGRAIQISIGGVLPEEEARINKVYPVSESGTISMPYIGAVRAAGLRSEDLANVLKSRYTSAGIYTEDVVFQVIDSDEKSVEQKVIFVGGDVNRTGPVPWNRNLTLYQAIQSAGGENEFGAIKRILLFRDGSTTIFNLKDPKHMQTLLKPDDTIHVPRVNWLGQ